MATRRSGNRLNTRSGPQRMTSETEVNRAAPQGPQPPDPANIAKPLPAEAEYVDGVIQQDIITRGIAGTAVTISIGSDLRKEYVASRLNAWGTYLQGIRSLPQSIDDITRDLGVDLYERMSYDPEINSLINTLKAAVLSQLVDLKSPIVQESDPEYKLAQTMKTHFQRSFANLQPSLPVTLDNYLDALALGNKVGEKIYVEGTGDDAFKFVLKKISVKHRSALFFAVDLFGNTLGFVPSITGNGVSSISLGPVDANTRDRIVPREKFAVLAFRAKDGDPRGTSILRSVYNAWWLKMQIWPELLKYLAQFGGPGIIGFASPDSRNITSVDSNGNAITQTPEQVMLEQLEAWRNGVAAAFPPGTEVEVVQAVGNGEAFHKSIDLLDRQMAKGVTGQELATQEGRHQSRASSEIHMDILELVITYIKQLVCEMLYHDVIKPTVELNWGEENLHLAPVPSLGTVRKQDKAALLASYTAAGYTVHASQKVGIDHELDIPPRDPASIQEEIDQQKKMNDIAATPQPELPGSTSSASIPKLAPKVPPPGRGNRPAPRSTTRAA